MNRERTAALEARRAEWQANLDATKSAGERNRLGQFATPNRLAVEIARFVAALIGKRTSGLRFADPALGTGSFFSAALQAFGARRINSAVGIELDPAFAAAARDLWADAGLRVVTGDFTDRTTGAELPPPNVVLANPPYVRHHHLGQDAKRRLRQLVRETLGVQVNGLAGLYVYFLLLATGWMEDDGHAAWLIPSEFMDVNYGAALKRFLTDRLTLLRVHRFDPGDVQFDDALVSSVVLVFRKAPPPAGHEVEFSFGGTMERPHALERVAVERLRAARKWTGYPRHSQNDRRIVSPADGPVLSDLFRIQRGVATGGNKFFILKRQEAWQRELPTQYLRPILPSPRFLKHTVIEADAAGYPLLENPLCLIDCDLPERLVAERHPTLWRYFQEIAALGAREGYLVGKRTPWYKQERREPSPFLCTYMGRGAHGQPPFRFIWNRSQAIGSNLYLLLYPAGRLRAMLAEHPARAGAVFELLAGVTGYELRSEGRVYGGGLNKIEPRELGRISAGPFVAAWPELQSDEPQQKALFDLVG